MGIIYYTIYKNYEEQDVEVRVADLDGTPSGPGIIELTASESPEIMDTPQSDSDKTIAIRGKRLRIGFLSDDDFSVDQFSDGSEARYQVDLFVGVISAPFIGNLILDDNSEPFQPKPNQVILSASDGLSTLKDIKLTDSGDLPIGHYKIAEYISMCLRNLVGGQQFHVVMNLYEEDSDPDASHAFNDIYLDALTFETDVDEREDCLTVLEKILDAFGCFIAYDHDGWWIIRWDEYDSIDADVTTLRVASYDADTGTFQGYSNLSFDKTIAHDGDVDYEGFRLSLDSAVKRFQRKAKEVKIIYNFEQPKEVPCNVKFTRGTVIDDVIPIRTYSVECWTMKKGVPGAYGSPGNDSYIQVEYDANEYETARFVVITPEATHSSSSTNQTYLESEPIPVGESDKFNCSVDWRLESDADFGSNYNLMRFMLHGDDGTYWLLGHEDINNSSTPLRWWNTSNWTVNTAAGGIDIDFTTIEETEWQSLSFEAPAIPVAGNLYIWLNQINQTNVSEDNRVIHYSGLDFEYLPYINGTYKTSLGQQHKVSDSDNSRRTIEKEIFISDSPRKLFKGTLKKLDGSDYVLTGNWNDYRTANSLVDQRLGKFLVFDWWNQYRKTRTVIETDVQGIKSDTEGGTPGLIHRWIIDHENQGSKYFMLTSIQRMDFRLCDWAGVFVEMSDQAGDRLYTDTYEFKYIQ